VKGKISGLGVILLLVVMAIVLYLTAQAWNALAPAALDVNSAADAEDHGELDEMSEEERSQLPGLSEMRERTDEHNRQVEETLEQID
jgi:hypothetical protein